MSNMYFIIYHKPIPQKRPRFAVIKGKKKVYDPQSKEKRGIKWDVAMQMRAKGFLKVVEGPVSLKLVSYHSKPKSWSQKRSKASEGKYVVTKPDADNICKTYLDVLNGIAYTDDRQISCLTFQKVYSDTPRVEIFIKEILED